MVTTILHNANRNSLHKNRIKPISADTTLQQFPFNWFVELMDSNKHIRKWVNIYRYYVSAQLIIVIGKVSSGTNGKPVL